MYLRKIRVQNLKLIRDLTLDLTRPDKSSQPWTVLVGRNGRGKTTILQAIALAAAGLTQANSLGSRFIASAFDRRREDSAPAIDLDASFSRDPTWNGAKVDRVEVRLSVEQGRSSFQGHSRGWFEDALVSEADTLNDVRDFEEPWWFVAGYGVDRRLTQSSGGEAPSRHQEARLRPLFEPTNLIGLGFADLFEPKLARGFAKLLQSVLTKPVPVVPGVEALSLTGRHGVRSSKDLLDRDRFTVRLGRSARAPTLKVPALFLSHGYQSSISWIADLLGQFLLELSPEDQDAVVDDPARLAGLVLVDELDLFLHPDWQVGFIDALATVLPNMQFIATTHSPLLLGGLRPEQVVILDYDAEGSVVRVPLDGDPRLMTATDMYRQIFGLSPERTPPSKVYGDYVEFRALERGDRLDAGEKRRLRALRSHLMKAGIRLEPGG